MIARLLSLIGLPAWGGYLIAGIVALLIGSNAYSYLKGRGDANANCRAAQLAAALAVAQADLAITQQAAQRDRDAVERLTAARQTDQEAIRAYEQTLAGRDACQLTADDLRSLQSIRGPR